jgi:hypothetical protein
MSYDINTAPQLGAFSVTITGGTSTAGGGQAAIPNPEGVDLVIANAFLYVASNSDGAANLTVGTAASGTVAATSMLPATAMAAAAGSVFNLTYQGTAVGAAVAPQKWGSAEYINVAASASAVGLSAILFVDYFRTS